MTPYYECHVTMMGDPEVIQPAVESIGWIFSKIDGDPVLGKGIKCYATKMFKSHYANGQVSTMVQYAGDSLRSQGINVLREKVELVTHDKRYDREEKDGE